jgi:hypothetical protein
MGRLADFYYIPLWQFVGNTIRESPGLVLSFVDGYRAHTPCDPKAKNLFEAGFPGASDHDWFRHNCARDGDSVCISGNRGAAVPDRDTYIR